MTRAWIGFISVEWARPSDVYPGAGAHGGWPTHASDSGLTPQLSCEGPAGGIPNDYIVISTGATIHPFSTSSASAQRYAATKVPAEVRTACITSRLSKTPVMLPDYTPATDLPPQPEARARAPRHHRA